VRALACAALSTLLAAPPASAAATFHTSRAAFDAAIADLAPGASLDFESIPGGSLVPSGTTLEGFTFWLPVMGVDVIVVDQLATTSGTNSLGTASDLTFLASDAVALDFPSSTAFGFYVIGEDVLPGDIELQTSVGVFSNGLPEGTVADGSSYFFLGVVESEPSLAFSTAAIVSYVEEDVGDFVWNLDDLVTAPEAEGGSIAALALAALAISRCRGSAPRRARSASRPDR